jgi:hypothetical protein
LLDFVLKIFVIKDPNLYLINTSRTEMEALRKVVNAGLLVLEGEDEDGLWANFTVAERKAVGHWNGNPLDTVTGPRQPKGLSSVA